MAPSSFCQFQTFSLSSQFSRKRPFSGAIDRQQTPTAGASGEPNSE
jgi:hypothetical protein